MRSSGNDDKLKMAPPIVFTLEEALEYIQEAFLVIQAAHHRCQNLYGQ